MKNKIEYEFSKSPENKCLEKDNEKKNFDDQVISVLDKSILYKRKEKKSNTQKLKELKKKNLEARKKLDLKNRTKKLKNNENKKEKSMIVSTKNLPKLKLDFSKFDLKKIKLNSSNNIFILILILCVFVLVFLSNSVFKVQTEIKQLGTINKIQFEQNSEQIDVMEVLEKNISIVKRKELVTENAEISYMTIHKENPNLPKDEQVVVQEGKIGRQELTKVRTYENDILVEEDIIDTKIYEDAIQEIIEIGTSETLKDLQIHIGDSVIVTEDVDAYEQPNGTTSIIKVPKYYDVKILEIVDNWSKVEYQNNVGYIKNTKFTTEAVTTGINNKSRITKIKNNVNINMDLTQKSGLNLDDYKKVLSNNSSDRNKIFENNYMAFYNIEQKYNINGIFLAAIAIHESGWGTSRIAVDKKNLFGFGSYDSSPYEGSYTFNSYEEGLEIVAKSLIKNYLNPFGTIVFDGETATGTYYNGPTVPGINIRYASDPNWNIKVFSKMLYLYNKL